MDEGIAGHPVALRTRGEVDADSAILEPVAGEKVLVGVVDEDALVASPHDVAFDPRIVGVVEQKPVIAIVFRLMFAIATFDTVYVLTKGGPARATDLVTLFIQREGFVNLNIALASAVSFLVLIAVLATTTILFKRELTDAK